MTEPLYPPSCIYEIASSEVILRAAPDALNVGIQIELIAVVRKLSRPDLSWSATIWAAHVGFGASEHQVQQQVQHQAGLPADFDKSDLDLRRLEEELPDHLQEAFSKIEAVAGNLEELHNKADQRIREAMEQVKHLFLPGTLENLVPPGGEDQRR